MEARSRFTAGVKITRKKGKKGVSKKRRPSLHSTRPTLHLGRSRPYVMERWERVRDGDRNVLGELSGIRNVAKRMAPAEEAGMNYVVDWARNIQAGHSEWGPLPKEAKSGTSAKAEDPEATGGGQDYRPASRGVLGKEVPSKEIENGPPDWEAED